MVYLIVRNNREIGSIAFKTVLGEALAQLKHQVSEITEKSKIEIITISRPEAYGEYSPYRIMGTKEEFIKEVKKRVWKFALAKNFWRKPLVSPILQHYLQPSKVS